MQNHEDLIEQAKSIVTILYDVVSSHPHEWETYLPSARSAMTALDHVHFFRDPERFAEQVWILHGFQEFAFHDADAGSIRDIAEWCQNSWLRILRSYPENEDTLAGTFSSSSSPHSAKSFPEAAWEQPRAEPRCKVKLFYSATSHIPTKHHIGLGMNWLQRAQATLARIQRDEDNSSSSQGGGQAGNSPPPL